MHSHTEYEQTHTHTYSIPGERAHLMVVVDGFRVVHPHTPDANANAQTHSLCPIAV